MRLAWRSACVTAAAAIVVLALPAPAPALDDAGYWSVADRLQAQFDPKWRQDLGMYRLGPGGTETVSNANLLLLHSVAALEGHLGPARQDDRARRLVESLFAVPPYTPTPPPAGPGYQRHAPGWSSSMRELGGGQHRVIDTEVVDALTYAWLARTPLGLSAEAVRLIGERVPAVARSRFWRWPSGTRNQINWSAAVYGADALITGSPTLLRHDLRLQLQQFLREVQGRKRRAGNLGPGLRFHYSPQRAPGDRRNLDSAEYGSIVASFTRFYGLARQLGMAPPPAGGRLLLQRWLRRVLCGYWTHAGYMNWDTGYGFRRWHQSHKLGLAQQALIGIATTPELADSHLRGWAKWILDEGFAFYDRQAARNGGVAPSLLFGVHAMPIAESSGRLGAARMAGNAARAVAAGLGEAASRRPPPLYAFDPGTGRLTVTTPAYNTAVVPVSQRAFPYGGIELARLYDARQEVAANIGGRPPAAFGLLVHDGSGRRLLATQTPRTTLPRRTPALRLTRAPAGVGVRPRTSRRVAYAGSFADLRATGTKTTATLRARTSHRFTAEFVETSWSLQRRAGRGRYTVDVRFPSWGAGATIEAVLYDGSRIALGSERLPLGEIDHFLIRSELSGYVIVLRDQPADATARASRPAAQSSAPDPGPTLVVELARDSRLRSAALTARLTIARG